MSLTLDTAENIDMNLAILEAITPKGVTWSLQEIADITGCHVSTAYKAQVNGLKKLKSKFSDRSDLPQVLADMDSKQDTHHPLYRATPYL